MKISILPVLILFLLFSSCEIADEDISCDNNYDFRTITCDTDENKKQDQVCHNHQWENSGACYICEYDETRIVKCATDETMEQPQICRNGDWKNSGNCLCPSDNPFCRKHAGLWWANVTPWQTYYQIEEYCDELGGGRIPTISELRSLIINCPATELGGECNIGSGCTSDSCRDTEACNGCELDGDIKYSVFDDRMLYSSTPDWDDKDNHWKIDYYDASIYSIRAIGDVNFYTRCVRK